MGLLCHLRQLSGRILSNLHINIVSIYGATFAPPPAAFRAPSPSFVGGILSNTSCKSNRNKDEKVLGQVLDHDDFKFVKIILRLFQ
jgi:hypothetical protein